MTIVTTSCLDTKLQTKQDILKKCDGTPLPANTPIVTCQEFTAVSSTLGALSSNIINVSSTLGALSSNIINVSSTLAAVSSALGGAASSGSVTNISGNVTNISNNLQAVSSALNNNITITNAISSTLANKATYVDVLVGTDDEKILSAKDVFEAYSTEQTIPIKIKQPINDIGFKLEAQQGTTAADVHYVIAKDRPNDRATAVTTAFYTNYTNSDKSFAYDVTAGLFGIGIYNDGSGKKINLTAGEASHARAVWGLIERTVEGNGRSEAVAGINFAKTSGESYGAFFQAMGEKPSGRTIGVYTDASNSPEQNIGVMGVTKASWANPNFRITGRQTGVVGYGEGSSYNNFGVEGYATAPTFRYSATDISNNFGVHGVAMNAFDNTGVYGIATGAAAGTNYGGRFVAQGATLNNYAIYGAGDAYITGVLSAQSFVTLSDKALKTGFTKPKDILAVKIQQYTKALPQPVFEIKEVEQPNTVLGAPLDKDGKPAQIPKIKTATPKIGTDGKQIYENTKSKKEIGVVAQDVQKLFPELVNLDERGYLTVDVVSVLFAYISSLIDKNVKQDKDIAILTTRLVAAETKLASVTPTTITATK